MQTRRIAISLSFVFVLALAGAPGAQTRWLEAYREPARRIIDESRSSTFAWDRLAELGDTFGNRLSGSENLDAAIKWAAEQMRQDGLEHVRLDPVKVPTGSAAPKASKSPLPAAIRWRCSVSATASERRPTACRPTF